MATDVITLRPHWRTPDWREPSAYEFTRSLTREGWAWEFLRRNPDYGSDWAWFSATWKALETEYGSPPHRDFNRWKSDPRAYRTPASESEELGDEEAVLIECWMGSKWGFYKFPLDPALDAAAVGEQLAWRPVAGAAREPEPGALGRLASDPGGSPGQACPGI